MPITCNYDSCFTCNVHKIYRKQIRYYNLGLNKEHEISIVLLYFYNNKPYSFKQILVMQPPNLLPCEIMGALYG